MISVQYPNRILCDAHFLNWLTQQQDKEKLLRCLMYIKATSLHHRKQHNLILNSECSNCSENHKIDSNYLGGAFKVCEDPEFISIYKEQISKNIIFAITLSDEPPHNTGILTSPDIEKEYLKNPHLKDMTSVRIYSGEASRKIIENFFKRFVTEKERQSIIGN